MLEVTDTQTDISRHFHPCFLLCPSFPFIYAYVGTFEFIRYRFLKSPSSFFCCLSSFISSLSGTIFVFGLISNDSIIFVSAIQYTWDIYHTCMLPFFSSFSYNLRILEWLILFFLGGSFDIQKLLSNSQTCEKCWGEPEKFE